MPQTTEHPLARRLRLTGQRLHELLVRRERRIITIGVIIFVAIVAIVGAWKIWALAYNALDLAIYNQVAWNSVHGRWFEFSIHPHSYLGDHLEIAFALLWPLYALVQHPLTLIVLQAAAIAIAAIPLMRIAAHFVGKPWHLLFGLAYLANPTIQNMALYEFHMLPFAIPLVSWALVGYVERKYRLFLLCAALALTVREDISFVIIGFGLLALADRRSWRWWAVPIGLGVAWLLGSLKLSAILNDYGSYKFLIYYAWLGDSVPNIILGALRQPWLVIQHLLSFQNLGFLAGLLLPFALLPIFRLRWMIPAGLTLLQLLLAVSSGELLIEIHYPAVTIPFLVTAAAAAFRSVLSPPRTGIFR
ncbi:MAG: DUF2079 domain-containing protein, partial [Candidatus Kerfeldbacteria bacterium]|nr:DUF2079 domain-containing protein [Candidatus Kerfeldbacteria bacterium]